MAIDLPATTLPDDAPRLDRDAVLAEVAAGLRNERGRIGDAIENLNYAELEADAYIERREGESEADYVRRPRKATGFAHQAVNKLCTHTYNPGPHRSAADKACDRVLQAAYAENHVDALMHEAQRLSAIGDVAAVQVRWTRGRKDRDVDLQLWGAEEFCVFADPDDPREPEAVVTIDRQDERTRYRCWFADAVHTFATIKAGGSDGRATAGGVVALEEAGSPRPNPYGCLPFAFVPYRPQVRDFWTRSPGTFLRKAEATANRQLSDLAQAIDEFIAPVRLFVNVGPEFNPELGPGRFLRLMRGGPSYSGDGFEAAGEPDARYLQAQLAIEECWADVRHTLDQCAEACDLPPGALRLDYVDAASGISVIIRAFPLLERARQRRPIYQRAETDLARLICRVYAAMAGDAALAAAARTLEVLLSWPEPRIPIPGPDRDESDAWEINLGIKSRVAVIEERYGLKRDQALGHLRRVAEDEAAAAAILPRPEAAPPPAGGRGEDPPPDDPEDEDDDDA
jgi:SPP1 Gp6-like portal protein